MRRAPGAGKTLTAMRLLRRGPWFFRPVALKAGPPPLPGSGSIAADLRRGAFPVHARAREQRTRRGAYPVGRPHDRPDWNPFAGGNRGNENVNGAGVGPARPGPGYGPLSGRLGRPARERPRRLVLLGLRPRHRG